MRFKKSPTIRKRGILEKYEFPKGTCIVLTGSPADPMPTDLAWKIMEKVRRTTYYECVDAYLSDDDITLLVERIIPNMGGKLRELFINHGAANLEYFNQKGLRENRYGYRTGILTEEVSWYLDIYPGIAAITPDETVYLMDSQGWCESAYPKVDNPEDICSPYQLDSQGNFESVYPEIERPRLIGSVQLNCEVQHPIMLYCEGWQQKALCESVLS